VEVSAGAGAARRLEAALALDGWMRSHDDAGYDPHDYLASPLVQRLTLGSRWGGVVWTQLGKRSPVQLRRLLGVPRARNAKGVGLVLAAQVRLARATGSSAHEVRARELADWLSTQGAAGYPGVGWGYPFPWANRDFYAPAGTPASVVTAFIGHALLDAAAKFGWEEARALAARGADFLRGALHRIPGPDGTFCFSYTPLDRRAIHNASLLSASLLARVGGGLGDAGALEDALQAARFGARAQGEDGAWPYGVSARNAWVDSFHTSYMLIALDEVRRATGTSEFDVVLERGLAYWRRSFFMGPAIGYYAGRPYPVDLHAVAHAILTLLHFRDRIPDAVATAAGLADWCLAEMRDPAGFFYYQKHRRWTNRLAYMRWIQAWMLLALAELAAVEAEEGEGVRRLGEGEKRERAELV
jgi:hypothetical protein